MQQLGYVWRVIQPTVTTVMICQPEYAGITLLALGCRYLPDATANALDRKHHVKLGSHEVAAAVGDAEDPRAAVDAKLIHCRFGGIPALRPNR